MKTTLHTSCLENLILHNEKPQMYRFAGGYYNYNDDGSLGVAHYYIADYQGPRSKKEGLIILREKTNIYVSGDRMVVNATTDEVEQVNHYYPYGALFAESTGAEKQPFKYNGKELDRSLNWYDHGARNNDAAIGRWHSIDPLAEKYYSISPYAYCAGDPVNLIDPTGMEGENTSGYSTNDPDMIAQIMKTYIDLYESDENGAYAVRSTYKGYEVGVSVPNPHPDSPQIRVADFETNELLYDISLSTWSGWTRDVTTKGFEQWNRLDNKSQRKLAKKIFSTQVFDRYSSISNAQKTYPKDLSKAIKILGPATKILNIGENALDLLTING